MSGLNRFLSRRDKGKSSHDKVRSRHRKAVAQLANIFCLHQDSDGSHSAYFLHGLFKDDEESTSLKSGDKEVDQKVRNRG